MFELIDVVSLVAFAAYTTHVSWTDLRYHLITNRSVLLGAGFGLVIALFRCFASLSFWPLAAALAGLVICFGLYLLLHLFRPNELGAGDVKLAGVLGIFIAPFSVIQALEASLGAFVLALPFALFYLLKGAKATRIAFAPFMLAAAWIVLLFLH
jgi:leader peptidase (prepilin peptidase)/N-methyltransferase